MSEAPAMSALTVRRPWSWGIVHGLKPIENRGWNTDYRGPFVVHAGLGWEPGAARAHRELEHLTDKPDLFGEHCPTGYVGGARLVAVCSAGWYGQPCDCGPWAQPGQYHWQLDRQVALPRPIPGPGQLRWFTPRRDAAEAVYYAMRGGV